MKVAAAIALLCFPMLPAGANAGDSGPRETISLNGRWLFQTNGSQPQNWKEITLPCSFEQHEGILFNGVGVYRREVQTFAVQENRRVLLHFQAAATEAEVWWNDRRLGSHLGGWTPFRFDVTDLVRQAPANHPHEIRVRLDEKVGHNSQGFLPIIAPHFGGIWQEVKLLIVPDTYLDDLRLHATGAWPSGELEVEAPLAGAERGNSALTLSYRLRGGSEWLSLPCRPAFTNRSFHVRAVLPGARPWVPHAPNLYEIKLSLGGQGGDSIIARTGFRKVEVFGPEIRLNGQALQVRGLLNWGYSPPLTAPNPGEETWRAELDLARSRGFNLMKFCLWVPPRRYLELADEMGMLTWMEYPTWHPRLTPEFLGPLQREFEEFFHYDRNSVSVILRSLTCETGPGADLNVISNLYAMAKRMIPGALVEDDSSWIGWNRVHDFYDDHPYGNNHTWTDTLTGFNEYILAHGLKPLVLGESIAADTWIDYERLKTFYPTNRPWYAPGPLDVVPEWLGRIGAVAGPEGLEGLRADSLRYGMLMRKYQAETYRREVPYGGYVITVIRDIPNASMGLLDYSGQPKWTEAEWAWQGDTMCLLKTEKDRRSYTGGERFQAEVLLSHFGHAPITGGELAVVLRTDGANSSRSVQKLQRGNLAQKPGTLSRVAELDWILPAVSVPTRYILETTLKSGAGVYKNEWPLWLVPPRAAGPPVHLHRSLTPTIAKELFPSAPAMTQETKEIVVASRFDDELVKLLESGGRVLLLPDGEKHSFPLNAHWFLRGAPCVPRHPLTKSWPHDLFIDLQHFDLASRVIPNINYLEAIDPILLLWDTHDLKTVRTHGLVFEMGAARGRLLVSALRHTGTPNAAGQWLLGALLEQLNSPAQPRHALPSEVWDYLKNSLHAEQTNLVARPWKFKPDPKGEGLERGWHLPDLPDEAQWADIRIGSAWESQGYPALDRWAWYRLWLDIPQRWQGREIYLSFEGVDDMYELYINGRLVSKEGDIATKRDTFSVKKSHPVSSFLKPGARNLIAIRVYDWYGAGGIFRPVTIGTTAFNPGMDLLR